MKSISVTLPDGSVRNYDRGTSVRNVASDIGKRLEEASLAAKVDGETVDLAYPLNEDARIEIITRDSKAGLEVLRHSTAHLLAQAIKELYPEAQITIGPVIEDGFYYDIDCPKVITNEDLPTIEKKMTEIASRNLEVSRLEMGPSDAIQFFTKLKENYKVELIQSFPPGDAISAYQQGSFVDLCRGPHVPNTSRLGKFKLTSVAGAYWRGDERNKMLQRIYGTAFATQKELDEHLKRLEEAKKRDPRKVGPELGLFTFLPIAPAMPFYLPKGAQLVNSLNDYIRKVTQPLGYQEVICPQLMSTDLWKTSGHLDNYQENMYFAEGGSDDIKMALKPMNCPGHCALFGMTKHSYRELPLRFSEYSKLHRYERAGVTHGLMRTRTFSQDDAHIFLMEDQLEEEIFELIKLVYRVYTEFGFNEVMVRVATRPEKCMGAVETWDKATHALENSLRRAGHGFDIARGEGAFYGPKIEFHIKDSLNRFWQCGTIQVDFNLPERFGLEFIDQDGKAKRPVMVHRAIYGSLERFMGILIEHHNGHLPTWIAPTQLILMNVTGDQLEYTKSLATEIASWGVRLETDFRNGKLGYKIREAQLQRIPLMLVIGNKEMEGKTLSVRLNSGENLNELTLSGFKGFLMPKLSPASPTGDRPIP